MSAKFLALINVPGYLGMDDEPPTFDRACEAWEYLVGERRNAEDDDEIHIGEGYSATMCALEEAARGEFENCNLDPHTGCGTIVGYTPGYDGNHDLGLAYSVMVAEV